MMHPKVLAALAEHGVTYIVRRHADLARPVHSPHDVAAALGYPIERVAKTLLLACADGARHGLAVCAVTKKLDLAQLGGQLRCARVRLAEPATLQAVLDYPPAGVSPLGAAPIPVWIDSALLDWPTILVGGGAVGVEVELDPAQLQMMTDAVVLPLTR